MPLAVNISFGNTYGPHDGTSLLERFLDDIANYWKSVICIGAGNEGAQPGHTSVRLSAEEETVIPFTVQENQTAFSIQMWKAYTDVAEILIRTPAGVTVGPIPELAGAQRIRTFGTEILLYYGEPGPYSTDQEIYLNFLPAEDYVGAGIWEIILRPLKVVQGEVNLWFPSANVLNLGTGFSYPTPDLTLTIPSTASRAITVAAYDALTFQYADFSGRGAADATDGSAGSVSPFFIRKPDLAAPGVRVTAPVAGNPGSVGTADGGQSGYASFTGTSFAAPFVTGAAALLMEWGIVQGNDDFLYGEKVKAYLQRGAKPLPGFTEYPNDQVGYGMLCVKNSIPDQKL
jgi:subtilisin family serine protease